MQMVRFIYHLLLTFMRVITPGTDIDLTLHPKCPTCLVELLRFDNRAPEHLVARCAIHTIL